MIGGLSNSVMMSWAIASVGDARRLLEVRNELSSALQQLHRGRTRHLSYVRSLSPIKQAASPSCPPHFFQSTSQNPKSLHFPMASPSGPVSGKGPITHIVFDMDGLLLGTFIPRLDLICCIPFITFQLFYFFYFFPNRR